LHVVIGAARPITTIEEKIMSGSIVVTEYMSLDGVIEDPVGMENSGLGNWTRPFPRGVEGDKFKLGELLGASALLFGRKTYDAFAAAWPRLKDAFAERMNSLPKYLASHRGDASWNNTTLIEGDLAEAARKLKTQVDGDILVYGSASIVHQLAPLGLIDEYRLMIYPTVLGRGKKMLPNGYTAAFGTEEVRQLGGGIVLVRYRPV
jgi:dihydrofolate reductase